MCAKSILLCACVWNHNINIDSLDLFTSKLIRSDFIFIDFVVVNQKKKMICSYLNAKVCFLESWKKYWTRVSVSLVKICDDLSPVCPCLRLIWLINLNILAFLLMTLFSLNLAVRRRWSVPEFWFTRNFCWAARTWILWLTWISAVAA